MDKLSYMYAAKDMSVDVLWLLIQPVANEQFPERCWRNTQQGDMLALDT